MQCNEASLIRACGPSLVTVDTTSKARDITKHNENLQYGALQVQQVPKFAKTTHCWKVQSRLSIQLGLAMYLQILVLYLSTLVKAEKP